MISREVPIKFGSAGPKARRIITSCHSTTMLLCPRSQRCDHILTGNIALHSDLAHIHRSSDLLFAWSLFSLRCNGFMLSSLYFLSPSFWLILQRSVQLNQPRVHQQRNFSDCTCFTLRTPAGHIHSISRTAVTTSMLSYFAVYPTLLLLRHGVQNVTPFDIFVRTEREERRGSDDPEQVS